ncbi:hypothetical protein V2J09_005985 [Rumex salicifolius]
MLYQFTPEICLKLRTLVNQKTNRRRTATIPSYRFHRANVDNALRYVATSSPPFSLTRRRESPLQFTLRRACFSSVSMAASFSLSSSSPPSSCYLHRLPSLPQQLSGVKLALLSPSLRLRSPIKSRGFSCRAASVVFRNLDADDFRHPLDRRNTLLLKAIPGLNDFIRTLIGSITEQVMLLENIGTSVLVSQNQLPDLHKLMVEAAEILNVEAPDLYVRQNPSPNAYTLAISGKKPFVVIHTSLIELLTQRELQAVIAHELGHLKCDHGVWLTLANILTLGAYTVPGIGGLIAQSMEEQLLRWLRSAELTCDRAALLVAQDPKVVLSVLMKLAGGCPSMADQLNVDAFLEQARSYEKASSSPVGWYLSNAQTRQLSHPLPVLRAREIDEWSRSQDCTTQLYTKDLDTKGVFLFIRYILILKR